MHDHEECMIVPEVWIPPDCTTTGGARVVAQQSFISSLVKEKEEGRTERRDKS